MFNAGDTNFDSTNFNIIFNIIYSYDAKLNFTFTFMHLADAFIKATYNCIQVIHFH